MFFIIGTVLLVAWLLAFFSVPVTYGVVVCLAVALVGGLARHFAHGRLRVSTK